MFSMCAGREKASRQSHLYRVRQVSLRLPLRLLHQWVVDHSGLGAVPVQRLFVLAQLLEFVRQIVEAITPGVPVIHFATGNPALLPLMAEAGSTVVGIDWRIRLADAWKVVGYDRAIQGNLDPTVLLADQHEIRLRAKEILDQVDGRSGHIFNLGHGVLPQTPVDNVVALVDAVHELSAR